MFWLEKAARTNSTRVCPVLSREMRSISRDKIPEIAKRFQGTGYPKFCNNKIWGYRKLLADIRKEMERGLKKVAELLERQKVLSYWAIGRMVEKGVAKVWKK